MDGGTVDGGDELAWVERRIRETEGCIMGQLAAIARLAAASRDAGGAERLLREMHHVLRVLHRHRRAVLGDADRVPRVGGPAVADSMRA